ncbi:unnamed protein product [Vitrella brassicaformis CCMP3155]|uniref:Uncharacterized protein n=1 Tax=Vitrella brassicaformis (strain CCMP3155) TaxID=1169540 RepID=A0A0G4F269_VITBC|nr:unnamed protein product [Vitrella brassicaformis CCMP3155]|eukprot:CEM06116.1 unnamed protein product [Vitrella brassicaformis CCMP3155]
MTEVAPSSVPRTSKPFGELHQPRSRAEKEAHLEVIDTVPFDMVDALAERNRLGVELEGLPPPISKILLRHGTDDVTELLSAMMQAVVRRQYDPTVWRTFHSTAEEHMAKLNAAEVGLILTCYVKAKRNGEGGFLHKTDYGAGAGAGGVGDLGALVTKLLRRFTGRHHKVFSLHGTVSAVSAMCEFSADMQQQDRLYVLEHLLGLVKRHLERMPLQQLSRVVLSWSGLPDIAHARGLYTQLLDQIAVDVVSSPGRRTELDQQAATSLATAYNRSMSLLGWTNAETRSRVKKLFDELARVAIEHSSSLTADQLSGLANSFSKWGDGADQGYLELYKMLGDHLACTAGVLSVRNIAVAVHAFAAVHILHEAFFHQVTQVLPSLLGEADPRQLCLLAHGYVKVGLVNDPLLPLLWTAIAERIHECDWQSSGMVLQAYTKSGAPDISFLASVCGHIRQLFTMVDVSHPPSSPTEVPSPPTPPAPRGRRGGGTRGGRVRGVAPRVHQGTVTTGPHSGGKVCTAVEGPPLPNTLACITYALAKGNCLRDFILVAQLATHCSRAIESFSWQEVSNLCAAFADAHDAISSTLAYEAERLQQATTRAAGSGSGDCTDGSLCDAAHPDPEGVWLWPQAKEARYAQPCVYGFFHACHGRLRDKGITDTSLTRRMKPADMVKVVDAYGRVMCPETREYRWTLQQLVRVFVLDLPKISHLPLQKVIRATVALGMSGGHGDDDLLCLLTQLQANRRRQTDTRT